MSDTINPTAPAAQEPAAAPPTAAAPSVPAPAAAAPQAPAARPPYVNPWQGRTPVAAAAREIVQTITEGTASGGVQLNRVALSSQTAAPAAPASDPRVDALMAVLGETVAQDLGALPANVAATVKAIAGDDPVAQRKAINAMRANGLAVSPLAAPAPLAPPASTTMPAPSVAPAAASPTADDASRLAEYEKLARVAPTLANAYRITHADSITRATAARTPAN